MRIFPTALPLKFISFFVWFFIFLIPFFASTHGQSEGKHWESYIPEKEPGRVYLTFGDKVNLRSEPNLTSAVLEQLEIGSPTLILEKVDAKLTQNKTTEFWYKIELKNKNQGYVWGGLLADYSFELGEALVLSRNPGPKWKGIELKALKSGKLSSSLVWKDTGNVSNEAYQVVKYPSDQFTNLKQSLVGFQYLVFSELEYGYMEEILLTFDGKNLNQVMRWNPGNCDPPLCSEAWIIFPKESVKKEISGKMVNFQGEPESIVLLQHYYDLDHPESSEIQKTKYKWKDGKFKATKETNTKK